MSAHPWVKGLTFTTDVTRSRRPVEKLIFGQTTHLEIAAEIWLCVAVHPGDLDVGQAGELLFGQVLPHGGEPLAVAAPGLVGKGGGVSVRADVENGRLESFDARAVTVPGSVEFDEGDAGGDLLLKVLLRQGQHFGLQRRRNVTDLIPSRRKSRAERFFRTSCSAFAAAGTSPSAAFSLGSCSSSSSSLAALAFS